MRIHQKLLKWIFHQLSLLVVWCQDHWVLDILHDLLLQCSQCISSLFSTISRLPHPSILIFHHLQALKCSSFFIIMINAVLLCLYFTILQALKWSSLCGWLRFWSTFYLFLLHSSHKSIFKIEYRLVEKDFCGLLYPD